MQLSVLRLEQFYHRDVHSLIKRKSIGGSFLFADVRPAGRRHPVTAAYLGNNGSMAGCSSRRGDYVRCIYGLSFPLLETVLLLKIYIKNICPAAEKKKPLLGSPFSMHKIISCGGFKKINIKSSALGRSTTKASVPTPVWTST